VRDASHRPSDQGEALRFNISESVYQDHPYIEELLWNVAVHSKQADPDIKLMGLHVQVRRSRKSKHWAGNAWPNEETRVYRTRTPSLIVHPAGKVTMSIAADCSERDVMRLFAHELRHIGQFHRGRRLYGYLTTAPMAEEDIEVDCYDFEDSILEKMTNAMPKCYRGQSGRDELLQSD
jgi:hypothetical protein